MGSGWSVSCDWEWAMAGRVFVMGRAARGFTVVLASPFAPVVWEFLSPPELVYRANVGEQARLDDGLVGR